jgi:cystathionine beta-synthase
MEGLFVGGSCGAAVAGAIKYAKASGRKENILVMLADGASKYISKIFNDDWMRENGFLDDESPGLGTVKDLLTHKGGPAKVETAASKDSILTVVNKLKTFGISQLPVVDDERLRGLIHESDLLKALVSGKTQDTPIAEMIESDYATVTLATKVELLKNVMNDAKIVLVMDGASIVGLISKIDLIDFLAQRVAH